jgi:regulator of sigma E protease
LKILIAIIIFSIIILFHELGHFLLAKANGIQVNEFCLGFGPTIVGFTKGETKYSLKLLPFGGACMMEGEDESSDNPRAFPNKSVWARISVVFAGPFFNFIMAFLFSLIIICCVGYDAPVISDVIDGYAAEDAGMQGGDKILKMNNFRVHFYREVSSYATFHYGESVEVTYERDGETYTTTLTPKYDEETGRYLYGFIGNSAYVKGNFFNCAVNAVYEVRFWIYNTVQSLRMLLTGGASVNDLSGPVGIVKSMGDTYEESVTNDGYFYAFLNMLYWGVLISANLGVMNLLPIPALDGGRLLLLLIEAVRRKRFNPEKEGYVNLVGLGLLMLLMVVVMFNDIRKLFI